MKRVAGAGADIERAVENRMTGFDLDLATVPALEIAFLEMGSSSQSGSERFLHVPSRVIDGEALVKRRVDHVGRRFRDVVDATLPDDLRRPDIPAGDGKRPAGRRHLRSAAQDRIALRVDANRSARAHQFARAEVTEAEPCADVAKGRPDPGRAVA